jgi:hypothetical protein
VAGTNNFSWSNPGHVNRKGRSGLDSKATAPYQTYTVSIAEGQRLSTSKRSAVNPEVFGTLWGWAHISAHQVQYQW